jgi:predicted ATP-dependent endonuclease of OLD family
VTISFREVGPSLHITLSSHATFFRLDEHSDGMRMFVALRAFVEDAGRDPKPILLIDEAEQHLHYDAQADLIRVLATQTDVKKVIYTTHSIGCLPQDLGRGARLVVPDPEASRSVVKNSWTSHLAGERWDGSAGLSPLMAAMGAKALALTPARTVVVTEGPSDALLLPTLLREATGRASLDYQIIAGLADITEERVEWIEDEAWRVIYLADGDNDGLKKRDLVLKAGVDEFRALVLPNGLTLEDLLAPSLYVEAVNNRLNLKPPHLAGITVADLSERNRSQSVRNWCKAHGIAPPGKIAVGEEIVRLVINQPKSPYRKWLDKERKTDLAAVHKQIADAIDRLPKRQGAA